MADPSRSKFKAWVIRNKGEWIADRRQYEWARFRSDDGLCIIYHDKFGFISSLVGKGCREAWNAFRDGRPWPLSTPPIATMQPGDHWRARAKAIDTKEPF